MPCCRRTILLLCATTPLAAQGSRSLRQHIEAAQRAQARQDCHAAAAEYNAALRLLPASGELQSNLGIALYCDGQILPAITAFKKALEVKPDLVAPHLFLGIAEYHLSDSTTAEKELTEAVRLSPADPTANLWLGYTLVAEHHYKEAIPFFAEAARLKPDNVDAQYALGQSYLEIGRQRARELQETAPQGARILQLAGEQYQMQGDSTQAGLAFKAASDRATSPSGNQAEADRELALYQQAHDAEQRAQAAFLAVLEHSPESDRAHEILGDIDVARRATDSAIIEYRAVLRINPTLPGIHQAISRCLMQNDRFSEALVELRTEQRLQPHSAQILTEIGRVQLAMGNEADAIASLREALSSKDASIDASLLLGKAMLRAGDAKAALPLLQHVIAVEPTMPIAYYLLARAYRMTGDRSAMASALQAYQRTSQDAQERGLAARVTQDPTAQASMNPEEQRDAAALASAHP